MSAFDSVKKYYSFDEFMNLTIQLVEEGKTTGPNQSENLIGFTKLNLQRMQRINKTIKLDEVVVDMLNSVEQQTWWVITEAWCGDSAQNLPVLAAMAKVNPNIDLRIILRDEHTDIMDQYLTNGGRSIPKMVVFNNEGDEMYTWGPRPAEAQQIVLDWKANPNGKTFEEFERELHTWYARNKTVAVQDEFKKLLQTKKELQS